MLTGWQGIKQLLDDDGATNEESKRTLQRATFLEGLFKNANCLSPQSPPTPLPAQNKNMCCVLSVLSSFEFLGLDNYPSKKRD